MKHHLLSLLLWLLAIELSEAFTKLSRVPTRTLTGLTEKSSVTFKNMDEMIDSFSDERILLLFTADNCGPCRLLRKELARVTQQVRVVAIDTEKWPNVGSRFGVGKLPCLVIMKNGDVLSKLEGLVKAESILRELSK